MLPDHIKDEAIQIMTDCIDKLGELDPSIEGYLELLDIASYEIDTARKSSRHDLDEEFEDLS